jgi:glycosyltransferase involved in cell wall biosynthesis
MGDRTFFVRPQAASSTYLAAADVVAIPSRYEGMSNVLLEAMAAGVPVVATSVSGNVDLIEDGVSGRLVPRDDPDALAAALSDVLASPGDLGARGREIVRRTCEMSHVVDLYEEHFLGSLRQHRQEPALSDASRRG